MIHSSPSHSKRGPSSVCSALTRNQTFAVEAPVFHMAALFQGSNLSTFSLLKRVFLECVCL